MECGYSNIYGEIFTIKMLILGEERKGLLRAKLYLKNKKQEDPIKPSNRRMEMLKIRAAINKIETIEKIWISFTRALRGFFKLHSFIISCAF